MRQDFSGVTGAMLAALFPIELAPYDPEWPARYREEEAFLRTMLPAKQILRVRHIGSTSVPGLLAKPTIDVLIEVAGDVDLDAWTERMCDAGYIVNHGRDDIITYMKGYTPAGFAGQVAHVHVRGLGDWDEPYFRDYLIAHPQAREAYAELKRALAEPYRNDRDGYTDAKGAFVRACTQKARAEAR